MDFLFSSDNELSKCDEFESTAFSIIEIINSDDLDIDRSLQN